MTDQNDTLNEQDNLGNITDKTGIDELDALLVFMEVVESRIDKKRPVSLDKLPNLIKNVCDSIGSWPNINEQQARQIIEDIDVWLEEITDTLTKNQKAE